MQEELLKAKNEITALRAELAEQDERLKSTDMHMQKLVREMNHRVRNNFQIISSLLSLQHKSTTEPLAKDALNEGRLRLQSLSLINQQLYLGDRVTTINSHLFLKQLIENLIFIYFPETKNFSYDFKVCYGYIDIDQSIPFALICNELMMILFKQSIRSNDELPPFSINLSKDENCFLMRIKVFDRLFNGVDIKDDYPFSWELINVLMQQLEGEFMIEDDDLFCFEFKFKDPI